MTPPRARYGTLTAALLAELESAPATARELSERLCTDESCIRVTLNRLRKRGEIVVQESTRDSQSRRAVQRYSVQGYL